MNKQSIHVQSTPNFEHFKPRAFTAGIGKRVRIPNQLENNQDNLPERPQTNQKRYDPLLLTIPSMIYTASSQSLLGGVNVGAGQSRQDAHTLVSIKSPSSKMSFQAFNPAKTFNNMSPDHIPTNTVAGSVASPTDANVVIEKKLKKLKELSQDDKSIIEKQRSTLLTQKANNIELNRKTRGLEEELRKLKIAYTNLQEDKQTVDKLLEAERLAKNSADKKIIQLQSQLQDAEKQIVKFTAECMEAKANEEEMRRKMLIQDKEMNEQFRVISEDLAKRNQQRYDMIEQHKVDCQDLQGQIKAKDDEIEEWKAKLQELDDEIQKNMAFKKGTHEYEIMVKRINKQDQDLDLYKKVVKKNERDLDKKMKEKDEQYRLLTQDNVSYLAEINTLRSEMEQAQKDHAKQLAEMEEQMEMALQQKEVLQEKLEIHTDEMRQIKDTNINFRQESNRLNEGLSSFRKKYEHALQEKFDRDDQIKKLQIELKMQRQEFSTVQEEKEAVENEFANRMRELEQIAADGGGVLSSAAILKAQDDLKTKLNEQNEELQQEKQRMVELEQELHQKLLQIENITEEKQALTQEKQDLQETVEHKVHEMGKRIDFLASIKDEFMNLAPYLERIKDILTCLSCMKFLDNPLMLQCGHSICKPCIERHLHPFKKDSMILCEKCTQATVAKKLKQSVVLDDLAFNFERVVDVLRSGLGEMSSEKGLEMMNQP